MCNIFDKRNNDDSDFNLKCRDISLRRKLPLSYSLLLASSVKFKKIKIKIYPMKQFWSFKDAIFIYFNKTNFT